MKNKGERNFYILLGLLMLSVGIFPFLPLIIHKRTKAIPSAGDMDLLSEDNCRKNILDKIRFAAESTNHSALIPDDYCSDQGLIFDGLSKKGYILLHYRDHTYIYW